MSIEEGISDDGSGVPFIDHRAVVVHNPNAECPIDLKTFGCWPQLVMVHDTQMAWTDPREHDEDGDDDS